MATAWTKLPGFFEHVAHKVHNLGSDSLVIALSNTAPGSESTPPNSGSNAAVCVLANVTQISYTNLSSRSITRTSSGLSSSVYVLVLTDLTLTASGGSVAAFRYVYMYNDTPTSPADPLIAVADKGSSITLADGESLLIDFPAQVLTIQ